jgi:hypothetical protein
LPEEVECVQRFGEAEGRRKETVLKIEAVQQTKTGSYSNSF